MGGGPDEVTSTTTSGPPSFLLPGFQAAGNSALNQFNQATGPNAGFGAAGVEAATGVPGAGGFDPIPFLTNQFNRAAELTRGRLDTEFAGAGRNLGASIPARSQELQDLAGNFFDPNNLFNFDPTNVLISRLRQLTPGGAGGTTEAVQPVFNQGLFG